MVFTCSVAVTHLALAKHPNEPLAAHLRCRVLRGSGWRDRSHLWLLLSFDNRLRHMVTINEDLNIDTALFRKLRFSSDAAAYGPDVRCMYTVSAGAMAFPTSVPCWLRPPEAAL